MNLNQIHNTDALTGLKQMADNSVDLIVTSPPYSDQRKKTYGGIHPDEYVDWFLPIGKELLPIGKELLRVLKPTGTFILNIKEKAVNGERHTYVIELILELRKAGFLFTEEFIWHKKNCSPGKWPNRFRDAWERCLQFNKQRNFSMYQDAVMVPRGDWKRQNNRPDKRIESAVGSGFGKNMKTIEARETVYPSNVLHLPTETANVGHSAAFPLALPTFFIKLFSKESDLVLDPFMGSGTTALASRTTSRNFIGFELNPDYIKIANKRLENLGLFR